MKDEIENKSISYNDLKKSQPMSTFETCDIGHQGRTNPIEGRP